MSNDSVTFHVRCEKLQHVMKINTPENIFDFIEIMKLKLNVEENDDIVILCPTTEGKMMELKTNADIEFIKKNKLCYNAISKEIYCNVELVIIVIKNEQQIQDDPNVQMKVLTNKVDQLSIQINKLSDSLSENSSNIMKILRSIVSENYHINKDFQDISSASIKPLDKGNDLSNIPSNNEETNTGSRKKKPAKKDKNKNPSNMPNSPAITSQISITKDSFLKPENSLQNKSSTNELDNPLKKLTEQGFTNTIQNIIVLKRFNNNYEEALTYLRSNKS